LCRECPAPETAPLNSPDYIQSLLQCAIFVTDCVNT